MGSTATVADVEDARVRIVDAGIRLSRGVDRVNKLVLFAREVAKPWRHGDQLRLRQDERRRFVRRGTLTIALIGERPWLQVIGRRM